MSSNAIVSVTEERPPFALAYTGNKDVRSRLQLFERWQEQNTQPWYQPDLQAYRDALLDGGMAPTSVASHLSTIRAAYRRLLRNNAVRDQLYSMTPQGQPAADRKAFVDEIVQRVQNGIDPIHSPVSVTMHQDTDDSGHLRLTGMQASMLLAAPGVSSVRGLRDSAIIAMMLCTGVREGELVGLDVSDLRGSLGGELALRVRHGKGNKSRMVPYGELSWCLAIVEKWLEKQQITEGPVFRGFHKTRQRIRDSRLTTRSVEYVLREYPLVVDGRVVTVRPHDCRRTYARRLYDAGMDIVAIQQNLGHADIKTTLRYIGALGVDKRRATSLYTFDLMGLMKA